MKDIFTVEKVVIKRHIFPLFIGYLFAAFLTACGGGRQPPEPPPVPTAPAKPLPTSFIAVPACKGAASEAASSTNGFAGPTDTDIRFQPAKNLSNGYGLSLAPAIAARNGKVYVVWYDNDSGNTEIMFSRSEDSGKTYSSPLNLSNNAGSGQFPSVAIDSDGHIHVAWQDTQDGFSDIFYVKSTDGGATFTAPVNISNETEGATNVSLAADDKGNVFAVWITPRAVSMAHTDSNQNINNPFISKTVVYTPSNGEGLVSTPMLTINNENNSEKFHLVWSDSLKSERQIRYMQSTDLGATFSAPITLAKGVDISRPAIAVDGLNNYVYVAYISNDEDPSEIFMTTSSNGGLTFPDPDVNPPVNITNNSGVSINPSLAVDTSGALYFAWQDTSVGNYEAMFSYSTDHGATFSEPVDVAPSAQGSLYIVMAIDEQKNIYMAWDDNRYPHDPNDSTSEANFEIAAVMGHEGLPFVASNSISSEIFSPNGDGLDDSMTFKASFTDSIDWQLNIYDSDDNLVFNTDGSDASLTYIWDGKNSSGSIVPDGDYKYSVTGNLGDMDAIPADGVFVINTVANSTAGTIKCFSEEASSFGPNGDGFKDSIGIDAEFNKIVDWTLNIEDVDQTDVLTLTGRGVRMGARWDGKDSNGQVVPEGNYKVTVTIDDGNGNNLVGSRLSAKVDTIRPWLTTLSIEPTKTGSNGDALPTISPNGDGVDDIATLRALPSETALVTVYVYESNGTLVRELDRSYHDPVDGEFMLEWDGKNDSGLDIPPGSYLVKIWCRDLGGNTGVTYPYELNIEVE